MAVNNINEDLIVSARKAYVDARRILAEKEVGQGEAKKTALYSVLQRFPDLNYYISEYRTEFSKARKAGKSPGRALDGASEEARYGRNLITRITAGVRTKQKKDGRGNASLDRMSRVAEATGVLPDNRTMAILMGVGIARVESGMKFLSRYYKLTPMADGRTKADKLPPLSEDQVAALELVLEYFDNKSELVELLGHYKERGKKSNM